MIVDSRATTARPAASASATSGATVIVTAATVLLDRRTLRPVLVPLLSSLPDTRAALHRVAVHVLARRRAALVGKIGLRAAPDGIAIAAAGPEHEVVRTSGAWLLRERTGDAPTTRALRLDGASLADAARLVEVDLASPLDVGRDTPPVGDPDAPLSIDDRAARVLGGWFAFGCSVLDELLATHGDGHAPSVVQLWPEHFDLGADVVAGGERVDLGASPGDGHVAEPYLYVGPWTKDRPGDDRYWNASFGATLSHADLLAADDPHAAGVAFLRRGLELLGP